MGNMKPMQCPFCKSNQTSFWQILGSKRHHQIKCSNCGAGGPVIENDHKKTAYTLAVDLWNKRIYQT